MSVAIRLATEHDFVQIHSLLLEFARFLNRTELVKITPAQMKEDKELFNCLIAEEEGTVIAFASYFFAYYSWTGKAIYLDDLYVREDKRGLGIGKKLLDELLQIARQSDCHKLKWQVSKWNESAIKFYKSLGAEIDDVEINCQLVLK